MKHVVIIPAYNEEKYIGTTLKSLINQSVRPDRMIVVNDGSTDNTENVVRKLAASYPQVHCINRELDAKREVGSKVVDVFMFGLKSIELSHYDLVSKFDADLEFGKNYIEVVQSAFLKQHHLGLCGGICITKKNSGKWSNENVTNFDHVRGALKTYRISAFNEIGGLIRTTGWDSVDEYMLRFKGWIVRCEPLLEVKHFRETNAASNWMVIAKKNADGLYALRYDFPLTVAASCKRMIKHKPYVINGFVTIFWYLRNILFGANRVVSTEVGRFIRSYRYKKIKEKLGII